MFSSTLERRGITPGWKSKTSVSSRLSSMIESICGPYRGVRTLLKPALLQVAPFCVRRNESPHRQIHSDARPSTRVLRGAVKDFPQRLSKRARQHDSDNRTAALKRNAQATHKYPLGVRSEGRSEGASRRSTSAFLRFRW